MSKDSNSLNIKILDKEYRVGCPAAEHESLLHSADFLNDKLNEVRSKGSILGSERIAIMVALNLAHELLQSQPYQEGFDKLDDRVASLQSKIDIALREIEAV